MKTILILTNEFPYGTAEPYMETEAPYYAQFDRVVICALQLKKEHAHVVRSVPDNVKVIPVRLAPKWVYLLNSFRVLFNASFYRELKRLIKGRGFTFGRLKDLTVMMSRSELEARKILAAVDNKELRNSLIYSYRCDYHPYLAMLLKQKTCANIKIVSRAHRYDLYHYARKNNYIPLREEVFSEVNCVFPCSADGRDYLRKLYPKFRNKFDVKYLGTKDHGFKDIELEQPLRIVSCSNMVAVKRIDKIIKALAMLSCPIVWTHFGSGALYQEMKKMAKSKLPDNVTFHFPGNISNDILMQKYEKEPFHIFLNVSESEGVPVSIMEAMSFGIPCIATDVGGTKEILFSSDAGILLKNGCTVKEISKAIQSFAEMPQEKYQSYRHAARKCWEMRFDESKNYGMFINEIKEMTK